MWTWALIHLPELSWQNWRLPKLNKHSSKIQANPGMVGVEACVVVELSGESLARYMYQARLRPVKESAGARGMLGNFTNVYVYPARVNNPTLKRAAADALPVTSFLHLA